MIEHIKPIDVGQPQVGEHEVESAFLERTQGRAGASECPNLEAGEPQGAQQTFAEMLVVFDQQQPGGTGLQALIGLVAHRPLSALPIAREARPAPRGYGRKARLQKRCGERGCVSRPRERMRLKRLTNETAGTSQASNCRANALKIKYLAPMLRRWRSWHALCFKPGASKADSRPFN